MMAKEKNLSNPFSTGGGGFRFETHVQASFVTLMLTGGYVPCLPCWPISEIKLQGKIDGFNTDDLIVVIENVSSKEQRKLIAQVKHSVEITHGCDLFGEVIQAAWDDYNNPLVFTRNKDLIALITGPISETDTNSMKWLLNQARHTKNVDEFFRNVHQANFSSSKRVKKLEAIQYHLKAANGGKDVSKDELYDFLNHFQLLGYDLDSEFGVVLSLLYSHISQFQQQYPQLVWSRIVEIVQTWNQDAGTITPGKLPSDLLEEFRQKAIVEIPGELKALPEKSKTDWAQHPDATYMAFAVLIGAWQDKSQCDLEALKQLIGISYDEWLKKAREILHCPDSPLSLSNGIWKVVNRAELWSLLGSRIFDQNLDTFRSFAISILKEPNPAFELPTDERYAASIYGKVLKYSNVLRKGIAEGFALLGSQPASCTNCSPGKVESTCVFLIRELFTDADWILWGSLNELLPALSEASPGEFLDAVEKAMRLTPCPFDELFSQEGNGITGGNYLTGLLWALEGLAWDEENLVRVCAVLCELASHDPGGQWSNRPFNSLTTILLPWLPQTLASADKRKVAVRTILNEYPDIAWNLIIQLLPGQQQTSFESHKPVWRKIISYDLEKMVTNHEYWQQVSFYAELAVAGAGQDIVRLSTLIDHFNNLPEPAFEQLLHILASEPISKLPEENRLVIWNHLTKFTKKHRRFFDTEWALPSELITHIELVSEKLAPTNPFHLYQHLFIESDFELYEEKNNWEEQQKKLEVLRETGIAEIFQQDGAEGVIKFAESVSSPTKVGHAIGAISDSLIERTLLPYFLDSVDNRHMSLVRGFIWRRHSIYGWVWCDNINKSDWTIEQIGKFLACLPFSKDTWDRASEWLPAHEHEYWNRAVVNAYEIDEDDVDIAIEKLIEHGRPNAAINCLDRMLHEKRLTNSDQSVRALLAALSSSEPSNTIAGYQIVELIKFLQNEPSVNQEDLFRIEWAYIPLLDGYGGGTPKYLEGRLALDPNFFCDLIRIIYRPNNEDEPLHESTKESKEIATNAWRLLHEWKTPPGTEKDGTFNEERFTEWLQKVKKICSESGHLEVALINIGEVLIYTPPDPDGLWIHRVVAAALNDREDDDMRAGFRSGTYNSRGVHWVDPTGDPERELARQFRRKAEEVENAGFQRFAITLRGLADSYDHEAERIIYDHFDRGEDYH